MLANFAKSAYPVSFEQCLSDLYLSIYLLLYLLVLMRQCRLRDIDTISSNEPASGGYKYVLCAVNQCTHWPEVVCFKNISAKSTCETLLPIFSSTGIPKLITGN